MLEPNRELEQHASLHARQNVIETINEKYVRVQTMGTKSARLQNANIMMSRSGNKFHTTSVLICSDCNEVVHVGFGGDKNLVIHRMSKACQRKRRSDSSGSKKPSEKPPQPDLHTFFKPQVPLNPPTVVAPPLIHVGEMSNNLEIQEEAHQRVRDKTWEEPLPLEAGKPC